MAKLIIYVEGNPHFQGVKRGDYLWVAEHKCYLWKGKVLEEREVEAEFKKAAAHFPKILRPLVKFVEFSPETPEITVAQAEAVMEQYAPHRLKGKPGPKPQLIRHIDETG